MNGAAWVQSKCKKKSEHFPPPPLISGARCRRNHRGVRLEGRHCCCCCCLHIINHPGLSFQYLLLSQPLRTIRRVLVLDLCSPYRRISPRPVTVGPVMPQFYPQNIRSQIFGAEKKSVLFHSDCATAVRTPPKFTTHIHATRYQPIRTLPDAPSPASTDLQLQRHQHQHHTNTNTRFLPRRNLFVIIIPHDLSIFSSSTK